MHGSGRCTLNRHRPRTVAFTSARWTRSPKCRWPFSWISLVSVRFFSKNKNKRHAKWIKLNVKLLVLLLTIYVWIFAHLAGSRWSVEMLIKNCNSVCLANRQHTQHTTHNSQHPTHNIQQQQQQQQKEAATIMIISFVCLPSLQNA